VLADQSQLSLDETMQFIARFPSIIEPQVQQLIGASGWTSAATNPKYEDYGYEPSNCHLSAKHRAIHHGGQRLHGWAIWHFDVKGAGNYVHAEHHNIMWADRTTLPDQPFVMGDRSSAPNWLLSSSQPSMVAYCKKLGIKPSDIATDAQFG
jgi:hypothetical protein